MDTASSAQIPYTHYHCPCLSPIDTDKAPSYDKDRGFSLAHLYYCEECDALRCSRCITSEIVTYYCPNCLFEVPGASVRGERNRCARNCFACPLCQAVLTVNGDPDGKSYWLSCGSCRWQSRQVGYEFEKPTGEIFLTSFYAANCQVLHCRCKRFKTPSLLLANLNA